MSELRRGGRQRRPSARQEEADAQGALDMRRLSALHSGRDAVIERRRQDQVWQHTLLSHDDSECTRCEQARQVLHRFELR